MWEVEFPKITELSCLLGGIFGDSVGKESTCNAGDLGSIPGFNPWVQKIPWRRERLPTTIFWPGEFHGLYSPWNSLGQNTGVGSLSLLQGIFWTQGVFHIPFHYGLSQDIEYNMSDKNSHAWFRLKFPKLFKAAISDFI